VKDIFRYIHYFVRCPHEFLASSWYSGNNAGVDANALLMDVLRTIDSSYEFKNYVQREEVLKQLKPDHLVSIQLGAWFFAMNDFQNNAIKVNDVLTFLFEDLKEVSQFVKPEEWISDEDRSEEFVRMALMACNLIPGGETFEEAFDRFSALSTLKRNNVLSQSADAFNRIIEIRRKMAEEKAREAANVYGRE